MTNDPPGGSGCEATVIVKDAAARVTVTRPASMGSAGNGREDPLGRLSGQRTGGTIMASQPAATWKAPSKSDQSGGDLDAGERNELPDSAYAFPRQRKEPLSSASHVRNAVARFDQVQDVSDDDRAQAFENIKAAAAHFDVHLTEKAWHDLMH